MFVIDILRRRPKESGVYSFTRRQKRVTQKELHDTLLHAQELEARIMYLETARTLMKRKDGLVSP